nr:hypothetical protein [Tanacetum cinerariifolium]
MPPTPDFSYTALDESAVKPVVKNKSSEEETKAVKKNTDALIIKELVSCDEEKNVTQPKILKKIVRPNIVKTEFVKPRQQEKIVRKTVKKVEHNRQNTHRPRGNQRNWNMMSQKLGSNFEIQVNAAHPKTTVNAARSMSYLSKTTHSTVKRPIHKNTTFKNNHVNQRVNIVKGKNVNTARPKVVVNAVKGNLVNATMKKLMEDMLLLEGTLMEGKSQEKVPLKLNSVLFNDTECILLSPNFKLIGESQVLLKVPSKNNMYSGDLKNIVSKGGLTFLFSKATSDESKLWHRRLGYLNFKTMNKLVKENLARGSGPDWLFDIDALTRTMSYEPIVAGTHSNGFVDEDPSNESECKDQEKQDNVNKTNNVNTISSTVNAADTNEHNELPIDPNIPALEDVGTFNFSNEDEDDDEVMDIKSAFLYGNIEKEVYVCQPPGFEDPDFPDRVYKVEKALYGLHQAPRAWYETLSTYLLDNGFQRGKIDKTLFIKRNKGDILVAQVYVDDIIFSSTRKELCNAFESQEKYVVEFLKKFRFTEVKNASTPMETQKPLLKNEDGEEVDVHIYQFNLKVSYLHAVKRIFRYLKGQPKIGLWYLKDSSFDLVAYTDSDYVGASLDRKSTTEGCKFLRCRLISCQCKKQTVIANSITEAKYVATSSCCGQVLWIQNQLLDYGKPKRKVTQVPQLSVPTESVADEAVYKELDERLVRAATTASSLEAEQNSGNIDKTQSKETPNEASSSGTTSGGGPRCEDTMRDTISQTRFQNVSKLSNDSLLAKGYTLQSDKDGMKLNELMELSGIVGCSGEWWEWRETRRLGFTGVVGKSVVQWNSILNVETAPQCYTSYCIASP